MLEFLLWFLATGSHIRRLLLGIDYFFPILLVCFQFFIHWKPYFRGELLHHLCRVDENFPHNTTELTAIKCWHVNFVYHNHTKLLTLCFRMQEEKYAVNQIILSFHVFHHNRTNTVNYKHENVQDKKMYKLNELTPMDRLQPSSYHLHHQCRQPAIFVWTHTAQPWCQTSLLVSWADPRIHKIVLNPQPSQQPFLACEPTKTWNYIIDK